MLIFLATLLVLFAAYSGIAFIRYDGDWRSLNEDIIEMVSQFVEDVAVPRLGRLKGYFTSGSVARNARRISLTILLLMAVCIVSGFGIAAFLTRNEQPPLVVGINVLADSCGNEVVVGVVGGNNATQVYYSREFFEGLETPHVDVIIDSDFNGTLNVLGPAAPSECLYLLNISKE